MNQKRLRLKRTKTCPRCKKAPKKEGVVLLWTLGVSRSTEWGKANPLRLLAGRLERYYHITLADWEQMLIEQSGLCAICNRPMTGYREPCVDHDHKTNEVRGLLCSWCNKGIGYFRDSAVSLSQAATYLLGS
jgi:hypothetical protein